MNRAMSEIKLWPPVNCDYMVDDKFFLFDSINPLKQCLIVFCPQMTEWLSCCVPMWFCSHSKTIISVLYLLYLIKYTTNHYNSGSLVMLNVRTLCTTMGNALEKERLPSDVAAIAYRRD